MSTYVENVTNNTEKDNEWTYYNTCVTASVK